MKNKKLNSLKESTHPTPAPSSKLVRNHSPSTMESGYEPGSGAGWVEKVKRKKKEIKIKVINITINKRR